MKHRPARPTNEEKFRSILENIQDGIIAIDSEWRIVYINHAAELMLNRSPGTLLEKNLWSEFPESVNNKFYIAYHEALSTQKSRVLEGYSKVTNKWMQVAVYPSPDGLSVYFHDVTRERQAEVEIRESELEYQQLMDRLTDGFISLDANFCYTYANKKVGELVRRDPDSLIGKNVWDEFPDAVDSYTYKAFQTAMREQRFISNVDYYRPLDLWQENYIYPSPEGLSVFIKDITEQKRLEKELLQAERAQQRELSYRVIEAQERERTKIGEELHDNINQLVTASKLTLALLRDNPNLLPTILPNCIANLETVIQENRKLSQTLVTPDLSKESLVMQLQYLVATMFQRGTVEVTIHTGQLDESLLSPPQKMAVFRIAQEQCTNIIKYAKASHVAFELATGDNFFTLLITDDGEGADLSTTTRGIGLRNMKSRIELFEGQLSILTQPKNGFRLHVQFPLEG